MQNAAAVQDETENLEIPTFLKRTKEPTMPHEHPVQERERAESIKAEAQLHAVKKPRQKTELPTSIDLGAGYVLIETLSLEELINHRHMLKEELACVPQRELELRAIVAEIRKKAK